MGQHRHEHGRNAGQPARQPRQGQVGLSVARRPPGRRLLRLLPAHAREHRLRLTTESLALNRILFKQLSFI